MLRRTAAWVATLSLGTVPAVAGQSPRVTPRATLPELACVFTTTASVAWTAGAPRVERGAERLELRLTGIDVERGAAELTYGAVTAHATAVMTGTVLTLMQPPDAGTTIVASVDLSGSRARFRASYARVEYYAYSGPGFVSAPRAEQRYGFCTPQLP